MINTDKDTAIIIAYLIGHREPDDFESWLLNSMIARLRNTYANMFHNLSRDKRRENYPGKAKLDYGIREVLRKELLKSENSDLWDIAERINTMSEKEKQIYKDKIFKRNV